MSPVKYYATQEDGSIMVLVIMILALMTIIGFSASNMSTTDLFIVRNVALFKQNLHLVDSAIKEELQILIEERIYDSGSLKDIVLDPEQADHEPWITSDEDWEIAGLDAVWYANDWGSMAAVLDVTNSRIPLSVIPVADGGTADLSDGVGIDNLLRVRGFVYDPDFPSVADPYSPIRYGFIGWEGAIGSSIKVTKATRKTGVLMSEYIDPRFGILRLEAGVEKMF